jgi:hypothetical protein
MDKYEMVLLTDNVYGGIGTQTYQITNYDNDPIALRKFVDYLNDNAYFWIYYSIIDSKKGIIEKQFDTKD